MSSVIKKGPNLTAVILVAVIFVAAVAGPWAWFNVRTPIPEKWLVFHPQHELSGLVFKNEPVEAEARETLATTNLLNGIYYNSDHRFYAFAADWLAKDARQMSVVQHTPDICWVGAGFELVDLGQPTTIPVNFGGQTVPFECRIFKVPKSEHYEMVFWCTLVSGQILEEGNRFVSRPEAGTAEERHNANGRLRAAAQFVRTVTGRLRGDGSKQFVRFSAPVVKDWKATAETLKQFAQKWLELEVQHPTAA